MTFNRGSYAMGTGIKPEDGDYDIKPLLPDTNGKRHYKSPNGRITDEDFKSKTHKDGGFCTAY